MFVQSAAFFLLTLALLVPTAFALKCHAAIGSQSKEGTVNFNMEEDCASMHNYCLKVACASKDGSGHVKGCANEEMCAGRGDHRLEMTKRNPNCKFHCCTGNLCNGALGTHPSLGSGGAVLVPLIISILAAAFGILF
ncbi:hypothetical protein niasHS_007857 [Heterodera schachtii]|uniref:Uncharacterized protein n=1 Tax=Heterodera schachtii TaxID=97005 RepID=A0ABD2JQE4_HETSC